MLKILKGMSWRAVVLVAVLAIAAPLCDASWRWEDKSSQPPASASSVTTSTSTISTSSSTSTSVAQPARVNAESRSLPPISPNETEARFLGGLKKKLCSVGLGINKELVFKGCKDTGVDKIRVTRQAEQDSADPATRFFGLFGSGLDGLKGPAFVPSFGVNFGSLPTGSGYGPYGSPHGSNPLGLDLGPVSINPFVGFKVAKLDGRPILNPTLDLLVTPNAKGVHAINDIKKGLGAGIGGPAFGGPGPYPGPYPPPVPGPYPPPVPGPYPPPVPGPYTPPVPGPLPGPYVPPGPLPGPYNPPAPYPSPSYNPYPSQPIPTKAPYVPPVYTPSKPVYIPPKPVFPPVAPPPIPSFPRPQPVADYSNQHFKPSGSIYTPTTGYKGERPVEVHHHEHTHFHNHDHDQYDSSRPFSPGGFVPSLSGFGRSESLKDVDGTNSLSPASSSSSFLPVKRFVESDSSKITFTPRDSGSSSSSSSDSSFKFPDS